MKPIKMTPVKSSQVSSHGYDPETQTLAVSFTNGGTYHYSGVPAAHYNDLCKAESIGKFLHANIKGKFKFKKLDA